MDIVGDRKFVEIPGTGTHELPPLLVHGAGPARMDRVMDLASKVIEKEDLIPNIPFAANTAPGSVEELVEDTTLGRRRMDMAVNMVDTYLGLLRHWHWGDGVLEWIRQCEITFGTRSELRVLLRPDVWPHAGRSSFVTLLEDKSVPTGGVDIEKAVGLRLTFRQAPPLSVFSDQFLFYLNSTLANTAYQTWARMSPNPISSLPPERFHINVVTM